MRGRRGGVLQSGTPRAVFFEPAFPTSPRPQSAPVGVPEEIIPPEMTVAKPKELKKEEVPNCDTPQKYTRFSPVRGNE